MTDKMAVRYLSPVKSLMKKLDFDEHYIEALNLAIKALEERPQGKWISVKDRLPDKDGDYIVTTEMFLPVNNFIREVVITYYNRVSGFCCETPSEEVIAWQELILPEPYKEEE